MIKNDAFKLRTTTVYVKSEKLALFNSQEPERILIAEKNDISPATITLDKVLTTPIPFGRTLLLTGIPENSNIQTGEKIVVIDCNTIVDGNNQPHTQLILQQSLQRRYQIETVTLYGNVILATHGGNSY